jgi:hypothetical protein
MKYHSIALGLLVSLVASVGLGQELTEQQKRRLHLPYIRAATDCYAGAIGASNSALDLAREGKWYDALTSVGNVCNAAAVSLIETHDRLYGPGTGTTFFKGPYLDDLPRAVGTRLKEALARRTIEVEQATVIRKQRIDEAARTRDLLRDRMYACTTKELNDLVASSESAEILTTAAMTICNREVQAALNAALELVRLEGGSLDGLRDSLYGVVKKNVVTEAVQAKATAKKADAPPLSAATARPSSARISNIQTPEDCLKVASSLREGQLIDQEKLITMMLDICRPEIENVARSKFLADPSQSLSDLRAQSLESAVKHAKSLVNAQ